MKRIMFVCQSMGNGGAERVVSVLANGLLNEGYSVYVLAMTGETKTYRINENIHLLYANKQKNNISNKIKSILVIRKVIVENNIDVVIAFSHYNVMYSVIATRGLKIKLIGSERNDPAQLKDRKIINFLREFLYKKLDYLVCQTDDAKAYFSEVIKKKTVVIMNPITDELPEPFTGKREKRVVSFSRLEKQKNIPMLIDAFERLLQCCPDYSLEIYGNGKEKENLLEYIRSKKLEKNVAINEFDSEIHERVKKAAMFVLASSYEGLSNSMIEAMAIGLPTIVTDCPCGGGRMVIIDGENGFLVPVNDVVSLFHKMKYIIENENEAREISRNSVKIRSILNKNKIIEEWLKLI